MKQKTCRVCKEKFNPLNAMQVVCSPLCALEFAKIKRTQAERKERLESRKTIRLKKEQLKTRSEWMKDAQRVFNQYIRERDKGETCICCGKPLASLSGSVGGSYDAGHYRSVGSAPHLRFDERNCHAQRKQCNQFGAGRAVDYRIGLIKKIGKEEVEKLESDNEPRKYSISDLKNIIQCYKLKIKELKCKTENSPLTQ